MEKMPAQKAASKMGYRILLIDDNRDLLEAVEIGLTAKGHEVTSTVDGEEALRLMPTLQPDIVVTDVILPDFDSIDGLVELRKIKPDIKIIAISGNRHLLTIAAKHGVEKVLEKPFGARQLDAVIRDLME